MILNLSVNGYTNSDGGFQWDSRSWRHLFFGNVASDDKYNPISFKRTVPNFGGRRQILNEYF